MGVLFVGHVFMRWIHSLLLTAPPPALRGFPDGIRSDFHEDTKVEGITRVLLHVHIV